MRSRVTLISSGLARHVEDGWLCATMMAALLSCKGKRNSSLTRTTDEFKLPLYKRWRRCTWFFVSRHASQNSSWSRCPSSSISSAARSAGRVMRSSLHGASNTRSRLTSACTSSGIPSMLLSAAWMLSPLVARRRRSAMQRYGAMASCNARACR